MINKKDYKGKILIQSEGDRIDKFLFKHFNSFSRTKIKNHIINGNILVNHKNTILVLKKGKISLLISSTFFDAATTQPFI